MSIASSLYITLLLAKLLLTYPPIIIIVFFNRRGVAVQCRVIAYITEAEEKGAKILLDGRSWAKTHPQGYWIGPTVILHSDKADRALHDEIFGPVLSVYHASSWDEAIAIENGNPYGNAACVYTEKGANAEWFIRRFRAAMLGVNIGIPVPRGRLFFTL